MIKIIGMPGRSTTTRFCKSRPLSPGRATSRTRQFGTETGGLARNFSAEPHLPLVLLSFCKCCLPRVVRSVVGAIHHERILCATGLPFVGLLNKQVGSRLGISEITVKKHRGNAMRKMKAESLVELAKMAKRLRLPQAPEAAGLIWVR